MRHPVKFPHKYALYYEDDVTNRRGIYGTEDEDAANYAMVPIKVFNDLMDMYRLQQDSGSGPSADDADRDVLISPHRLHGLEKALRIVRDRAKQQVDKGKADTHGYTLISADKRAYGGRGDDLIRIVRRTPHSVKIPLEDAKDIILLDLIEYYHYVDPDLLSVTYTRDRSTYTHEISVTELLKGAKQRAKGDYADHDFYVDNNEIGRAIRRIVDGADGKIAFDLDSLIPDYGQGVYKVGYWATDYI